MSAMSTRDEQSAGEGSDNAVFLRGRLAADPVARTLPSGDELCSFRLTVTRPQEAGTRSRVDSIDCATTTARARRCLDRAAPGTCWR